MIKKRILVVDDEKDLLDMMRGILANWGYDVITADSGREALRIVREGGHFLDVVILDIVMPGLDGVETLRHIRRHNKLIPVFMLTGYPSSDSIKKTRKLGISGFIAKGEEFVESARVIKTVLSITKKPAPRRRRRKKQT
ncbi:MAG: response regulator [Candidatus Omnitrophica bacterium]|nr:response regulator [Candidatus Omnitrophota bacterium]